MKKKKRKGSKTRCVRFEIVTFTSSKRSQRANFCVTFVGIWQTQPWEKYFFCLAEILEMKWIFIWWAQCLHAFCDCGKPLSCTFIELKYLRRPFYFNVSNERRNTLSTIIKKKDWTRKICIQIEFTLWISAWIISGFSSTGVFVQHSKMAD